MKRIIYSLLTLTFLIISSISKGQTAMQISGPDCNNVNHDLYAELDAGKAAILFFFMDNCNVCPPPAQNIQAMVNNILVNYPGMVTAYAIPYNNVTTCAQTASWVSTNNLNLYAPYDSGAVQVVHYGGFGMPTVVLLGGSNHRTLFKTKVYTDSDTTIMRDSILALFAAGPSSVNNFSAVIDDISIFPNPSSFSTSISLTLVKTSNLAIEVCDISGKVVQNLCQMQKANGHIVQELNTSGYPNGHYFIKINADGKTFHRKLIISH
jgi:Secretion system C-terminal sorting domain